MLTKANLRYLSELQQKKYRLRYQRFLVEGAKSVVELLEAMPALSTEAVYGTAEFAIEFQWLLQRAGVPFFEATAEELSRAGSLITNHTALAVAHLPAADRSLTLPTTELTLALADVRDPGNVGTILRLADWYGITQVICSPTCADPFSPKAIAASMGSFTRVGVWWRELPALLAALPADCPVYGADLAGANVHHETLRPAGLLVLGSESHGLPAEVAAGLTQRLHIPRRGGAESLNVAMATAILLDNFFRHE